MRVKTTFPLLCSTLNLYVLALRVHVESFLWHFLAWLQNKCAHSCSHSPHCICLPWIVCIRTLAAVSDHLLYTVTILIKLDEQCQCCFYFVVNTSFNNDWCCCSLPPFLCHIVEKSICIGLRSLVIIDLVGWHGNSTSQKNEADKNEISKQQ